MFRFHQIPCFIINTITNVSVQSYPRFINGLVAFERILYNLLKSPEENGLLGAPATPFAARIRHCPTVLIGWPFQINQSTRFNWMADPSGRNCGQSRAQFKVQRIKPHLRSIVE
jgi:hypothetical protein